MQTTNKVKTKRHNKQTRLQIMPTLKGLDLYKTVEFPRNRYTVVSSTIQKVQMESEKRFSYRTDKDKNVIEVTRIN